MNTTEQRMVIIAEIGKATEALRLYDELGADVFGTISRRLWLFTMRELREASVVSELLELVGELESYFEETPTTSQRKLENKIAETGSLWMAMLAGELQPPPTADAALEAHKASIVALKEWYESDGADPDVELAEARARKAIGSLAKAVFAYVDYCRASTEKMLPGGIA